MITLLSSPLSGRPPTPWSPPFTMENGNENNENPPPQERPVSPSSEEGGEKDALTNINSGDSTAQNENQAVSHPHNSHPPEESLPTMPPPTDSMLYPPMSMPLGYFAPYQQQQPPYPEHHHHHALPFPPAFLPPHPNNNNNHLDATRQFYEQQMREHAMQYANAAANAAWAAARIAYGDHASLTGSRMQMYPNGSRSAYVPAGMQAGAYAELDGHTAASAAVAVAEGRDSKQRTLWKPSHTTKTNSRKKEVKRETASDRPPSNDASSEKGDKSSFFKHSSHDRFKKKRGGSNNNNNDSVSSSLGNTTNNSTNDHRNRSIASGGDDGCNNNNNTTGTSATTINTAKSNHSHSHNNNQQQQQRKNQRQKRNLYQSHSSPRGSFSSLCNTNSSTSGGMSTTSISSQQHYQQHHQQSYRHKRRNVVPSESKSSSNNHYLQNNNNNNNSGSGVVLSGLIGKSGVSALHEMCSKYRWEMPTYNELTDANHERVVGGGEIREGGGGGSTASSTKRSHGSYASLQSFVLSVRVNGVELGRGRGGTKGSAKQDASRKALAALIPGVVFDPNGILLDIGTGLLRIIDENSRSVPTSLEELAPHLASQLAIGVSSPNEAASAAQYNTTRPSSPDISEDSSISTAVSMTKGKTEHVILGGLLQSSSNPAIGHPGIYPSASSASEVDDDDEYAYHKSTEDRACSILLHAMWQIDYRIREPPSYDYDLIQNSTDERYVRLPPLPKDRMPFQCTASLKLYFSKRLVDECKDLANIMDYWESPLEHSQAKLSSALSPQRKANITNEQSRKRKDSFASQTTPSPARQLLPGGKNVEPSPTATQEQDEMVPHKIESTGIGSTKRESKHRASAKLLAMLFPECSSTVEVMAAAEAARECYAAKKGAIAQTKRAKLSNGRFSPVATGPVASAKEGGSPKGKGDGTVSTKKLPPVSDTVEAQDAEALSDGHFSVAGLSLSEVAVDRKRRGNEVFESEVDIALKALYDGKGSDDSGGFLLRRVNLDDFDRVCSLLDIDNTPNTGKKGQRKIGDSSELNLSQDKRNSSIAILQITRSDTSGEETPLGVSIVSVSNKKTNEQMLSVHTLKHNDHVPRESFIDCLEELSTLMHCNLDLCALEEEHGIPLTNQHLQSVQEEDEEEGSEEEANDLIGRKRSRVD